MPPKASTSAKGGQSKGKLSPIEQQLLDVGSQAPNREIGQIELFTKCGLTINNSVQDAVNTLLRKNLMQMLRTQSGLVMFRFLKKDEAKAIGAMDSEEKLVLDHIKDSGNLGIWTKTLTNKTGLARTTITKVLKILEGRKSIKTVKSVKFPTRKIYMLAGTQPSVELTGGPWFTDNELDTELVDTLKMVVNKHLQNSSIPKSATYYSPSDPTKAIRYRPIYPVSATPFLPTIETILNFITAAEVIQVELQPKHVESLMDLMVYDGMVEKVFIGNQEDRERNEGQNGVTSNGGAKKNGKDKKGKRRKQESESESESESSDDGSSRKKKKGKKGKKATVKRSKSGKAKKKRTKLGSDEDEEEESSESEFDEDAPAKKSKRRKRGSDDEDDEEDEDSEEDGRKSKKSKRKKKDRSKKRLKALASDGEDSDDDMNGGFRAEIDEDVKPKIEHEHADGEDAESAERMKNYVYRLIRPYTPVIGWTDMPCGKCPVEEFCTEPSRPRAGILKRPTTALDSTIGGGGPKMKIELEGGIQGVGMLGGVGAAVGVSLAKWGEMKGQVGKGVAPVNPRDCVYFKDWLTADGGQEE